MKGSLSRISFSLIMAAGASSAFAQCGLSLARIDDCAVGQVPGYAACADFDNDGNLDIASASRANTVLILRGNGVGQFQDIASYSTGTLPDFVTSGDFNNDGKPDIAVANWDSNDISLFLGNGDCSFAAAVHYYTGANPASIAVADFNSDGKEDLAIANDGNDTISIMLGNGDGTFPSNITYAVGSHPRSVSSADLNGDGRADLAVANYLGHTLSILISNANGTLQSPVSYSVYPHPHEVSIGDFNGDGVPDLVAPTQFNNVAVLLGDIGGTFAPAVFYPVGGFSTRPFASDMNGDGIQDIVVTQGSEVSILRGNPAQSGTFLPVSNHATVSTPGSAAVGDFNNDGKQDIATPSYNGNYIAVILNTSSEAAIITQQPVPQSLVVNQTVIFNVEATGSNLQFQWRHAGVGVSNSGRFSGADTSSLTISGTQLVDQGMYDCVITSSCNTVTSNAAELSCRAAFASHPVGGSYFGGDQIQLSASVQPAGPVTYRWRKNGASLFNSSIYSGVSTATLTINATDPTQSGQYTLAATNSCGTTLSGSANVVITCRADFNGDDGVDFFDYLDFVDAFSSNDSLADFNGDGSIDFFDYLDFVDRFSIGC